MDFAVPTDHKEKCKKTTRLTNTWILLAEKAVDHEGYSDSSCSWNTWKGIWAPTQSPPKKPKPKTKPNQNKTRKLGEVKIRGKKQHC